MLIITQPPPTTGARRSLDLEQRARSRVQSRHRGRLPVRENVSENVSKEGPLADTLVGLVGNWFVAVPLLLAVIFVFLGMRLVPNTTIGIIEKRLSGAGSVKSGLIALRGEAGFQPRVLRGGLHFLMPVQYAVHVMPLVTIPQGKIGYVFARDGAPLPPTQALGSNVAAADFSDVGSFLAAGGQKGPQRKILREGTYAINLAQFVVITAERVFYLPLEKGEDAIFQRMAQLIDERDGFEPVVLKGHDDLIGIVTVHDGPSIPAGQIIAPTVGDDPAQEGAYHNSFQDPERFLAAGGQRGRQLQPVGARVEARAQVDHRVDASGKGLGDEVIDDPGANGDRPSRHGREDGRHHRQDLWRPFRHQPRHGLVRT